PFRAALEPDVVVDADARQRRDLLAPQPRGPPHPVPAGQPRLLRREPGAARAAAPPQLGAPPDTGTPAPIIPGRPGPWAAAAPPGTARPAAPAGQRRRGGRARSGGPLRRASAPGRRDPYDRKQTPP